MSVDEKIYASCIFDENGAIFGPEVLNVRFGDGPYTHPAGTFIRRDCARAEDFCQLARAESPECVHLPQSVLGGGIALEENRILPGSGFNMRHTAGVAQNERGMSNRSRNFA